MTLYTHTTFAAAKTALALRLDDAGKLFHVDVELGFAIVEALRIWNALTGFCRAQGEIALTDGTAFYQLGTTLLDSSSVSLRSMTIRDRSILSEIEYHLMEPQGLDTWAGTDQFSISLIMATLQKRRDQFLADTACTVEAGIPEIVTGNGPGTLEFPDNVIGVRRATFVDTTGRYHTLRKSDEFSAKTGTEFWRTAGVPNSFSTSTSPNLTLQLIPPPAVSGTVESVIVSSGGMLNSSANSNSGTLLNIPDDLAWGIKYGALADLFRDQSSLDLQRAQYCEALYVMATQLAKIMPVILAAQINGRYVNPAALYHTDGAINGWQGTGKGTPKIVSIVAPDYIAVTPIPDNRVHRVTLDVIRTAIVPTDDDDYLQIGRESLDALLCMAQRICMLKYGGAEFAATESLAGKFFEQAQAYALRRSAAARALQIMRHTSDLETSVNQWSHTPKVVEDKGDEVKSERNARRRPFRKG